MKIHKSKSGSYYIRPYIWKDGVKKQTTYHFKTKEEALKKILELEKSGFTAKKTIEKDYSFEYVYHDFMNEQKRKLKPTSYYSYKTSADKHLMKHFRNISIHRIDRSKINAFVSYLNNLDVGVKHKNKLLNVLKSFFRFCVVNYQTQHEWVSNLEPFKETTIKKDVERKRYYTEEEFNLFIGPEKDPENKALFTVLFYSGLRIAELRGLTWADWNPKNMSLRVNKQKSSKIFEKENLFTPKSKHSNRTVFIPTAANNALKEFKRTEKATPTSYIFNISETEIHRRNKKIAEAANIERIKIHEFRHSYATMMAKKGMNLNILKKQLGHSDIRVTSKYYMHYELDDQSKEVSKLFEE